MLAKLVIAIVALLSWATASASGQPDNATVTASFNRTISVAECSRTDGIKNCNRPQAPLTGMTLTWNQASWQCSAGERVFKGGGWHSIRGACWATEFERGGVKFFGVITVGRLEGRWYFAELEIFDSAGSSLGNTYAATREFSKMDQLEVQGAEVKIAENKFYVPELSMSLVRVSDQKPE